MCLLTHQASPLSTALILAALPKSMAAAAVATAAVAEARKASTAMAQHFLPSFFSAAALIPILPLVPARLSPSLSGRRSSHRHRHRWPHWLHLRRSAQVQRAIPLALSTPSSSPSKCTSLKTKLDLDACAGRWQPANSDAGRGIARLSAILHG